MGVRVLILCVITVALFAVNLFWLQPRLAATGHGQASLFVYLGVRVLGFVALAFSLVKWAKRNRFQTMSTVMWVGVVDQVVLKYFSTKAMFASNPGLFGNEPPPTNGQLLFALAQGFLFFAPILLILGFLGYELNRFRKDWASR